MTATTTATMAAASDGARLWNALRTLTDNQREQLQRSLAQCHSVGAVKSSDQAEKLVVVDGHEWTLHAFVQVLLGHLRHLAHEQSHVEAASGGSMAGDALKKPAEAVDDNNAPHSTSAFALEASDFPSLGGKMTANATTTTSVSTRPPVKPLATKRRITTTLIATDAPYAAVAVKRPSIPSETITKTSTENVWAKRDLLERRMAAAAPSSGLNAASTSTAKPLPPPPPPPPPVEPVAPAGASTEETLCDPWRSPPPTIHRSERKPPSLTLVAKSKRAKRLALSNQEQAQADDTNKNSPTATATATATETEPMIANLQAAHIYGQLIVQRFVPSICGELQFLMGLVHRPSCATTTSSTTTATAFGCSHANEFCHSDLSSAFAAVAIETLEPTIAKLGSEMVQLVTKSLEEARLCTELVTRLRSSLETREERRVRESAKLGCELPIETTGTAFRDFALPFCDVMDSRLNYRSPSESVVYSNREKIRDAFLSQLRTFQKRQNSLLGNASPPSSSSSSSSSCSSAALDAQQLLKDVMHENLWWFARFFVLELVQIGSNPLGESDNELVKKIMEDKMVVKNPDRLRKLHRRFSSQKTPDPLASGGVMPATATSSTTTTTTTTTGFSNNRGKPPSNQHRNGNGTNNKSRISPSSNNNSNNNSHVKTTETSNASKGSSSTTTTSSSTTSTSSSTTRPLDHMRGFFSDNQAFFFHFLVSCDSFQFAQLVTQQLHAQFLTIWQTRSKAADPRKGFTESVLRLKVLAKFIGFVQFSPQWHWAALTAALSAKNPALEAAQREAVATLEKSQATHAFDVLMLLEESVASGTVAKCIPWLCDYLSMLTSDVLSSSTRYFHRVLLLLSYVHRSTLLDQMGETGLYVAMQIERLFQLLSIDDVVSPVMRWRFVPHDKPPSWMKVATWRALLRKPTQPESESDTNNVMDELPFLYSNMFVQVCISELDDLRGFIQTRANPQLHKRKSSATTTTTTGTVGTAAGRYLPGERSSTLRKVRPLQVVNEQQRVGESATLSANDPFERAAPQVTTQPSTSSSTNTSSSSSSSENPLRDAFFKLYPQLKQAVEFVVDMVVTTTCEHAIATYVKPNADTLIDSCVDNAKSHAPSFTQLILHAFQEQLDEKLEPFIATTVARALQEATKQCHTRVASALRPLIAPSVAPQLVTAATTIAQAQATTAITSLITRSLRTEFLKRVAQRKRLIVKEAGASAAAAAALDATATGSSSKDGVARALTFSFDEDTDGHVSPLEEAVQAIKRNVVGMHGALQAGSSQSSTVELSVAVKSKRMVASFTRFQRAFRDSLEEAIEELRCLSSGDDDDLRVVLWSWSWRAVRLWLKAFASLLASSTTCDAAAAAADRDGETVALSSPVSSSQFCDFAHDFIKTLRVITQLSPPREELTDGAADRLCTFVMDSALALPSAVVASQIHHQKSSSSPPSSVALPDAVIDACAVLLQAAHAVRSSSPSAASSYPSVKQHDSVATEILTRAFPSAAT